MSRKKKGLQPEQQPRRANKLKVQEQCVRRERISLRTWEKFERWLQQEEEIEEAIGEVQQAFKDHVQFLHEELSFYGEEFEEFTQTVDRLSRLFYLVGTGKRPRKRKYDYYEEPPEPPQKGKQRLLVVEVTIEDISDGTL